MPKLDDTKPVTQKVLKKTLATTLADAFHDFYRDAIAPEFEKVYRAIKKNRIAVKHVDYKVDRNSRQIREIKQDVRNLKTDTPSQKEFNTLKTKVYRLAST